MGFLQCEWSPAKLYPVTGSAAFTICAEHLSAVPRARAVTGAQNLCIDICLSMITTENLLLLSRVTYFRLTYTF